MVFLLNTVKPYLASITLDSPVTCSSNNTACDNSEDNLLDTVGGVATLEECRQLCYDSDSCGFLTYYGLQSFPYQEFCFLLRSCEQTHSCDHCVSETRECYATCSLNLVGVIDSNFLDLLLNVPTEVGCRGQCVNNDACSHYTYFTEGDPQDETCILLSSLMEPLLPCDTCVTGPADCDECSLIIDGQNHKFLKLTEPG